MRKPETRESSHAAIAAASFVAALLFLLLVRESVSAARLYAERVALEIALRTTCDRLATFDPHDPTLLAGRRTLETYRDRWFEPRESGR